MLEAAGGRTLQNLVQPRACLFGNELPVLEPQQRAAAHAKIHRVVIKDSRVAAIPAKVAVATALGVTILHFSGEFKETVKSFRTLFGLAQRQGVCEQRAR